MQRAAAVLERGEEQETIDAMRSLAGIPEFRAYLNNLRADLQPRREEFLATYIISTGQQAHWLSQPAFRDTFPRATELLMKALKK